MTAPTFLHRTIVNDPNDIPLNIRIDLTIRRFERYLSELNPHQKDYDDIRKHLEYDLIHLRLMRSIFSQTLRAE